MAFVTYEDLGRIPLPVRKSSNQLIKEASASAQDKHVFLSHSNQDSDRLARVIRLFDLAHAPVYVDVNDQILLTQGKVSAKTARVLRARIQKCPRFVLVTSNSISTSRWTPWELGFADGQKGSRQVALFPLVPGPNSVPSAEQEYLDLYPRIELVRFAGSRTREYAVRNPRTGRCWRLHYWLHSGDW